MPATKLRVVEAGAEVVPVQAVVILLFLTVVLEFILRIAFQFNVVQVKPPGIVVVYLFNNRYVLTGPEIIVKEMMPNLAPFIVATFITSVSGAVLASIGLEALGLGPFEANTLGMTIYWNIWYASLINGWWWWWAPPIIIIVMLFVGLFLVSQGLDEWANPRLRKSV